ncbi:hypothetical protein HY971_02790 [Candidatus Kaiserbacteria bacterium]|nr:hypothetical protein [Candidatus Kaiserbacteria bacterium]
MEWFRTHPYASALSAAGVLVVVGAYIVVLRASEPTRTQATAWGGAGSSFLDPTSFEPPQYVAPTYQGDIIQQVQSGPPYTYITPVGSATSASVSGDNPYDFEAFIAMLIKETVPKRQAVDARADSSTMDPYAYIPRGLISTTTPPTARTSTQQALYDYGNDIGSSIESFEQQHTNTVQILKEQAEDRADPDKATAVVNLGRAFQNLGSNLSAMDNVPSVMVSAHAALAKSYIELGKNLALIPGAERDSDFIQAIQTYNASADTFTGNYIRIVSLFGAYGVTFTSADSGRVFTFSPSGF